MTMVAANAAVSASGSTLGPHAKGMAGAQIAAEEEDGSFSLYFEEKALIIRDIAPSEVTKDGEASMKTLSNVQEQTAGLVLPGGGHSLIAGVEVEEWKLLVARMQQAEGILNPRFLDMSLDLLVTRPRVVLFLISVALSAFFFYGFYAFIVYSALDKGLDSGQASFLLSLIGIISMVGRIGSGFVCTYLGASTTYWVAMVVLWISSLLLIVANTYPLYVCVVVAFGTGTSLMYVAIPESVSELLIAGNEAAQPSAAAPNEPNGADSGTSQRNNSNNHEITRQATTTDINNVVGLAFGACWILAAFMSGTLSGMIRDAYGSYAYAEVGAMVLQVVATGLSLLATTQHSYLPR